MKRLNVLVTGASQGIGSEVAKAAARESVNVILFARSRDKFAALAHVIDAQFTGYGLEPLTGIEVGEAAIFMFTTSEKASNKAVNVVPTAQRTSQFIGRSWDGSKQVEKREKMVRR